MDTKSHDIASLSRRAFLRQTSKVGAVCGNAARTDLCGGRQEIDVPTATEHPERIFRDGVLWTDAEYLCDSGTEFEGLKIWGMPWTTTFPGMNPHCKAFTKDTEYELQEHVEMIPEDTDILITHGPAFQVLDKTIDGREVGHGHLYGYLRYAIRPKLHVFGHIHEGYGQIEAFSGCISINASHVNEKYHPVNAPIRVIL